MSKSGNNQTTVFTSQPGATTTEGSGAHPHYQHTSNASTSTSFGPLPSWFPHAHPHGQSSYGAATGQPYSFGEHKGHGIHPSPYPLTNPAYSAATYAEVPYLGPNEGRGGKASSGTSLSESSQRSAMSAKRGEEEETSIRENKRARVVVASPPSGDEDDIDERESSKGKEKKKKKIAQSRRRVVVACDTCRRKKVKCEGLPNESNTCNNCFNMNYTCTFTVEPDRSRGRYEILEAQRDTILAALRTVAPEMAEQFDRGELSASTFNGVKAAVKAEPHHHQVTGSNAAPVEWKKEGEVNNSTSGRALEATSPASTEHDAITLPREPKQDLGPMIPDLEDGRPRYFGGSSNLTNFHNLDSRPPSPGFGNRQSRGGLNTVDGVRNRDSMDASSSNTGLKSAKKESHSGANNRLAVLPRPRPQYPSNSVGWVRHVRRKTLVAVGRDEHYAVEGWFQRFQYPEAGLLNELLDLFFHQLNPLLPIIHEHSLRRDLAQGRAEKDSAFRGLVFTIIAIASRFFRNDSRVLADKDDPTSAGDHWAAASRFHHQVYAASLINVQVLLLSSTFMPSTLGVGTSWTVLGVAIRALQDIGLHTEKAYGEYTPFEQEIRRRTFWAAFIMDGILSINMGRPSALRLADTSVKFPLLASEEALMRAEGGGPVEEQSAFDPHPCPAAGFIHLIKLNIIAQDVVSTLYAPRWKPEFVPSNGSNVHMAAQQKSPATYKDMTILSKRLDEWVAEIPTHLQSIRGSPYKEQAGLLQCGRHDIRLYILKPFLQDGKPSFSSSFDRGGNAKQQQESSILKKMLLPQCVSHARECLRLLAVLWEDGQLSHMVFILQQAFLSAATFMLTIWHGTSDVEALSKDKDLIESTLSMLRPEENRYCSALLRRAQRILCNIARRALRGMTDEKQKQRVQALIDLHGVNPNGEGSRLFSSTSQIDKGVLSRPAIKEDVESVKGAAKDGISGTSGSDPTWDKWGSRFINSHLDSQEGRSPARIVSSGTPTSTAISSSDQTTSLPATQHLEFKPSVNNGKESATESFADMDQWLGFEDPFSSSLRNDPSENSHHFEFNTDLTWTDYFSKFLGGLPNPSSSPLTSGIAMSPLVNQTP